MIDIIQHTAQITSSVVTTIAMLYHFVGTSSDGAAVVLIAATFVLANFIFVAVLALYRQEKVE